MTTIILIGVASLFALCVTVATARTGNTKTVDTREKAEIIKRLLALSERESAVSGTLSQESVLQTPTLAMLTLGEGSSPINCGFNRTTARTIPTQKPRPLGREPGGITPKNSLSLSLSPGGCPLYEGSHLRESGI